MKPRFGRGFPQNEKEVLDGGRIVSRGSAAVQSHPRVTLDLWQVALLLCQREDLWPEPEAGLASGAAQDLLWVTHFDP